MNEEKEKKINVIAVVGPTASGKTRLGVCLAKAFGGEVISADSMQIYEGMDISSAKPTEEEKCGVPHHLMGFLPKSETYSVASYTAAAKEKISEISSRGRLPIIVGGTGLYVDSLLNNISFAETKTDEALRRSLFEKAQQQGAAAVWEELASIDPDYADKTEPNNIKRVIRAIEVCRTTGMTMTEQIEKSRLIPSPYNALKIGLKTSDREVLYERINMRVDEMVKAGLEEEARELLSDSTVGETAKKAIGCKELAPYFEGTQSFEEAIDTLKRETRRYAKRQLTWFKRDEKIHWFNIDEHESFEEIEKKAVELVKNTLNI